MANITILEAFNRSLTATKKYVDEKVAEVYAKGYLTEHQDISGLAPKANPSFTGNVTVAGKVTVGTAPTENMDVATKQYVDNAVAANAGSGTGSTADYGPYSIRYNSSNDRLEFIYTPHTTERISLSWTANTNITDSGIIISDNLAMVTDFIAKEDGYKYLLYLDNTTSTMISFWDSSKKFISRSNDYTVLGTDVEIEFPEGTAYFRVKTDAVDPVTIDNVNEHVIVKKVSI